MAFQGGLDQRTSNHMLAILLNRRSFREGLILREALHRDDADHALLAPSKRASLVKDDDIDVARALHRQAVAHQNTVAR